MEQRIYRGFYIEDHLPHFTTEFNCPECSVAPGEPHGEDCELEDKIEALEGKNG